MLALLAARAEMRTALRDDHAADGSAARGARFAGALIDAVADLEEALAKISVVAEEVRNAMGHDPFYADKDPKVFGRAVVGAVNDTVGYFLTHPGADAEALASSLCRIFAP